MDIAGAKALKDRLGPNCAEEAPPVSADIPADAPPVYHWTGVSNVPDRTQSDDGAEASATGGGSMFSRLVLSFR
jgi:hypothetical protein